MVVVSDNWVKYVSTFPTPVMSEMEMIITNNETKMTAKAMLICRQNSHPFQDRTLVLDEPAKVGRSVARARAKPNNAIFDCKVLSRNHALLWYENGKFFLQDTKSSNGTYINNTKLLCEVDHEVSSGDIVQFGVEVVENNRKVTHGCIIATLKLYLPDGKEAKASPNIGEINKQGMVPLDELYKLNQIIQDASDREECLQKKLAKLQSMLQTAKTATSSCWAAYVGEERLLSRIATLETQLSQANKNWTEDRCKQELNKIQDENVAYQVAAIEALEKLHNEKLDAVAYVSEMEIKENILQQETNLAKIQVEDLHKEIDDLLKKFMEEQKKTEEMRKEYEAKIKDLQKQLCDKHEELTTMEMKLEDEEDDKSNSKNIIEELKKSNYICSEDDAKIKEEMLENEEQNHVHVNSNEQNNIHLTVGPVKDEESDEYSNHSETESNGTIYSDGSESLPISKSEEIQIELSDPENSKLEKGVKFDLPEEDNNKSSDEVESNEKQNEEELSEEKENELVDHIDSKTLKYHFHSTQNELKKRIEILEQLCKSHQEKSEEVNALYEEDKKLLSKFETDNKELKDELNVCRENLERSRRENYDLKNEVNSLLASKEIGAGDSPTEPLAEKEKVAPLEQSKSEKVVGYEELVAVEEELVLLKERFSQVNAEKVKLLQDIEGLKKEYFSVKNHSHTMTFLYVAPLVLIVLYLLISNMFS